MGFDFNWQGMSATEAGKSAQDVMRFAMDWEQGEIANFGSPIIYEQDRFAMSLREFRFTTPSGIVFRYEVGAPLTVDMTEANAGERLEDELELFGWGTVFGAVAWFNGLVPLHASANEVDGRAIAFTGPSGAGKSTMGALMAQLGHRHICDDTLVLVPSADGPLALPDHKPLKLWQDSMDKLGLSSGRPIKAAAGKHYVSPQAASLDPVPVTDLVFLKFDNQTTVEKVSGRDKLLDLPQAMYRDTVHIERGDNDWHAKLMTSLCEGLRMWRFARSTDQGLWMENALDLLARINEETRS